MQIKSLNHPLVKHWNRLRKSATYREESGSLLLIGEKMVREFPFPIKSLISVESDLLRAEKKYLVTENILEKITGIRTFQGLIAEVLIPKEENIDEKDFVLILDEIQDPGNLGTLLRCALALGWDGVIATPGTVDFFNDKALRASQGAIFHLPFSYKSHEELILWLKKTKRALWIADGKGEDLKKHRFQAPLALVLSNEGRGLSPFAKNEGQKVAIPIQNGIESLNVATAGSILLYQMKS